MSRRTLRRPKRSQRVSPSAKSLFDDPTLDDLDEDDAELPNDPDDPWDRDADEDEEWWDENDDDDLERVFRGRDPRL